MIGKRLAHYEIIRKLGEGGMGVVYEAIDHRLDRRVALKILPPERVADPTRKQRFIQEAKAASALNHPNIVTIYDLDAEDGCDHISMELAPGHTLEEMVSRRHLRVAEVLRYAVQIADAPAVAHAASIVHRDLKPANIMVTDRGMVKVLDFGLVKLGENSHRGRRRNTSYNVLSNPLQFSVTARGIYFLKAPGTTSSLAFYQFSDRKIVDDLASFERPLMFHISVSPDERSALYTQLDRTVDDLALVENFR